MRLSYKHIMAVAMTAVSSAAMAQTLNSAYFTEDYQFRHTMNPAFANERSYVSIPALGNINVKVQGNFGYEDIIMPNPMYPSESEKRMTTFMNPYIPVATALDGLSTGNNRIIGDVGVTLLSGGFKAWGGYNTVEVNSKTSFGVSLPYGLFEFAKNIGNNNYDIGDINVNAQSYVELALGHSRQINDKLRLGAKLKLLFGVARADMQMKNMKAELASEDKWIVSGEAQANVSMKGFAYKQETADYKEEGRGQYQRINDVDIDGAGLGGFGMAVDLGGVYKINDDWTVSASLLDLGFISWSNDMQAVNISDRFEFGGFHDVAVTRDRGGEKLSEKSDRYADQLKEFANLRDNGDGGGRTTGIGMTINLAGEYTLPVYRKIKFGALSSTRIRGAYTWTEGRLSANYTPLKWLDGGVSFAVNSFSTSMGWVINIHPKGYNFFIGMDHLLGKTSKEGIPLSSNANVALGMSVSW
ncbi:MAG: hypothetical protein K2G86_10525 [Prevotella sp.]|nr:hypothetical protein [Prevotella sp.]